MSNISIPDLPERIPNELSFDPDSKKIVTETEESMVSIEQDVQPIDKVQFESDTNPLHQVNTNNQDQDLQHFAQDLNSQSEHFISDLNPQPEHKNKIKKIKNRCYTNTITR